MNKTGSAVTASLGGVLRWMSMSLFVGAVLMGTARHAKAAEVTSNADTGAGSLRQAVIDAAAGDTITFNPSVTAITLTSGEITINKALTIQGPGAGNLTITAGAAARIFNVNDSTGTDVAVTISGVTLTGGNSSNGGAIQNNENLTVSASIITGNTTTGFGGGIRTDDGSLNLVNSTVSGNSSDSTGGGVAIFDGDNLTITNSTISGNTANGTSNGGGVVVYNAETLIQGSTISGNIAGGSGGGIFVYDNGNNYPEITIVNCTIAGNSAKVDGGGIFSYLLGYTHLSVRNCTISGNIADSDESDTGVGGGVRNFGYSYTVDLTSTIVAGNTNADAMVDTNDDFNGYLGQNSQKNLIGVDTGLANPLRESFNKIGTATSPIDPKLGALALNGAPAGSPLTQLPDVDSPALDAGQANGLTTDQRGAGFPRVNGFDADIGAVEAPATAGSLVVTNLNDSGPGSLRNAINTAKAQAGADTITFQAGLTGTIPVLGQLPLINHPVTITGPGEAVVTLDAQGTGRIAEIVGPNAGVPAVAISGLTLTGGANEYSGGAIRQRYGSLTLTNVTISGNDSNDEGGGVHSEDGNLTLTNATFDSNSSVNGGGAVHISDGTLTIQNSVFTNNDSDYGGALYLDTSSGTIADSRFESNYAQYAGGAVYIYDESSVVISNTQFKDNASNEGAGAIQTDDSTVSILKSVFTGNDGDYGGALYLASSKVEIKDSTFGGAVAGEENSASSSGGAIYIYDGSDVTIENTQFVKNTSGGGGGAIETDDSKLTIQDSTFTGNTASYGGALYLDTSTVLIKDSTFTSNVASSSGGAVYVYDGSDVTIEGSTLEDNTASLGGGVWADSGSTLKISGSTIRNNDSTGDGGGIANDGTATISDSTIAGNSAAGNGGGLYNSGTVTVERTTLSGNTAVAGAGVYNGNSATIRRSTVSGNNASGAGGGINNTSNLLLVNSTVSGNTAGTDGGGIQNSSTLNLESSTIASNTATAGSGGGVASSTNVNLKAVIVADNTAGTSNPDVSAPQASATYSLIETPGTTTVTLGHNITGVDPALGALANNGGPTLTHAIAAGSPAHNTGSAPSSTEDSTDQIGNSRVQGTGPDIGAVEVQDGAPSLIVTNNKNSGIGSLRRAVNTGNAIPGPNTITFAPSATGTVDLTDVTEATISGAITLKDGGLTITGPGFTVPGDRTTAAIFTVDAVGASGIFNTDFDGGSQAPFVISGLKLVNGNQTYGGALRIFTGDFTLNDVVISDSNASQRGGAINLYFGTLSLNNVTLSGNNAGTGGGAIYAYESTLTIQNSVLSGNDANYGGALYLSAAPATIKNTRFEQNTASTDGGAAYVYDESKVTIENSTFVENSAADGGAIKANGSELTIQGSKFSGNAASDDGGAIFLYAATATVKDSKFGVVDAGDMPNSSGSFGGALYGRSNSTVSIANCTIAGNTAATGGGGVGAYNSTFTIVDSTISANSSDDKGGGIVSYGATVQVKRTTISNNTADSSGGGIWLYQSNLEISNSTVSGNEADSGGGIYAYYDSRFTVRGSIISDNKALNGDGGGICLQGSQDFTSATIIASRLSGNTASGDGGGIFAGYYSEVQVISSSITGSTAGGSGGGIHAEENGSYRTYVTVLNSTISGNTATAGNGGGINANGGYLYLDVYNSTVAFNSAPAGMGGGVNSTTDNYYAPRANSTIISGNSALTNPDVNGTFDAEFTLIQNPGTATITETQFGTNQLGVDPLLDPVLAANSTSGVTQTHALQTGSPAKDAGRDFSFQGTDQRGTGFARFSGLGVDIGAFEEQEAPKTFIVTNTNDSGDGSLRAALTAANSWGGNDTIQFQAGLTGNILLTSGEIAVKDSVTIPGPGATVISVDGNNASRALYMSRSAADVSISGLTFQNGNASGQGGALDFNGRNLSIADCVFTGNRANNQGGAVHLNTESDSTLTITNSVFSGNTAESGGGGVYFDGGDNSAVTILNSQFLNNSAGSSGGALYASAETILIDGCTITGNVAGSSGGGLYLDVASADGLAVVQNSTISNNSAESSGGGISADGNFSLLNATVANNFADSGGGGLDLKFNNYTDAHKVENCVISGNSSGSEGGGISFYSRGSGLAPSLLITGSTISGNKSTSGGGGVYTYGSSSTHVTIQNSTLSNNSAGGDGGGLFVDNDGIILVESSVISGNFADGDGGGIYFYDGEIHIRNSTIDGNKSLGDGGGIYVYNGDFVIESSTISNNVAGRDGGGIYLYDGDLRIVNSTISGNRAEEGGGIFLYGGALTLLNSTVTANEATNGNTGGIYFYDGSTPVVKSSIISGNKADSNETDFSGGSVNAEFSLFGSVDTGNVTDTDTNSNILNEPALLSELADRGGPTKTHGLLLNSPGIDVGSNPNFLKVDQRGLARTVGAGTDIGATENAPVAVADAGGPYTINEGDGLNLASPTVDPDGDPLTYSWDINGDGIFGDATGKTPVLTPAALQALGIGLGTQTYNLRLQVSDGVNTVTSPISLLTVLNVNNIGSVSATPSVAGIGQLITFVLQLLDNNPAGLTITWDFGDGSSGTGATATHAYTAAGTYTVTVTANDGINAPVVQTLQVTVKETVFGSGIDSDGDGFSDEAEIAAGSDPFSASSNPIGGAPVTPAQPLTVSKLQIGLNFAKANSDSIAFSGVLPVPAGFQIGGKKVVINVGGVTKSITLDAKGKAPKGNNQFKITLKAKKGVVAAQNAKFSVKFSKGDFDAALADEGLTNTTEKNKSTPVLVQIIFNDTVYEKLQPQLYSANSGKTGKTKQPK